MRTAMLIIFAVVTYSSVGCQTYTCRSGSGPCSHGGRHHGVLARHRGMCGDGCGQGGCSLAGNWDNGGCSNGGCGNLGCRRCGANSLHARHAGAPTHIPPLPHGYAQAQSDGTGAPPSATYAYPYYTIRAPRDFLLDNPPTIGP